MAPARNRRRRPRRRGRFSFLYKLLAVAALVTALVVGATVFFRVERVEVTGHVRYTAEEVIAAAQVETGENLFGLNQFEISKRIRQQLPYIEAVQPRMSLPDTLVLDVRECKAAARLVTERGDWLLSPAGKVLELVSDGTSELIELRGLQFQNPQAGVLLDVDEAQTVRMTAARELLATLAERTETGQVTYIDLSSPQRIVMDYGDRFTVRLPVMGDYPYLLRALDAAVEKLESYEMGTMDLTVQEGTVIFSPG